MTVNNKIAKPRRVLSNSDRERLGELLRKRLIECGWKDQVRMLYHQVVRECAGENITFEMIISKMTPRAHALVPDVVKKEFIKKIIACRGPRIIKYAPKTQNGQPMEEDDDLQIIHEIPQTAQGPEQAQVVPQGGQHDQEQAQQVPHIEYLPEIPPQASTSAQEVPQMD